MSDSDSTEPEPAAPEGAPADEATPAEAGADAPAQAEPEPEPEAAPEPDPVRDPIVEQIRAVFGDDVLGTDVRKGDLTIRVSNAAWHRTAEWAKAQGFTYFCFLSGIDWLPDPEAATRYENTFVAAADSAEEAVAAERTTGYAGGDTRFQVLLRLYDVDR